MKTSLLSFCAALALVCAPVAGVVVYAEDAAVSSQPSMAEAAKAMQSDSLASADAAQAQKEADSAAKQQACADAQSKLAQKSYKDSKEKKALEKLSQDNCKGACFDLRNGCKSSDQQSGACGQYSQLFRDTDAQCGLPAGTTAATAKIESSCRPCLGVSCGSKGDMRNPNKGMFQLTAEDCRQFAPGTNLADPASEAKCFCGEAQYMRKLFVKKFGREPEGWEYYMMHQQRGYALKMMANPDCMATKCGLNITGNGGFSGQTSAQYLDMWKQKFADASNGVGGSGGTYAGNSSNMWAGDTTGASNYGGVANDANSMVADMMSHMKVANGVVRSGNEVRVSFSDGSTVTAVVPSGSGLYQCNPLSTQLTVANRNDGGCTEIGKW